MAVEVKATATAFEAVRPREIFQTRAAMAQVRLFHNYDVTAGPPPLTVVMNWAQGR